MTSLCIGEPREEMVDDYDREVAAAALFDRVGGSTADLDAIPSAVADFLAAVGVGNSADAGGAVAEVVQAVVEASPLGDNEAHLTAELQRTWDGLYDAPLSGPERRAVRSVVSVAVARRRPVRVAVAVAPLSVEHTWLLTLGSGPKRALQEASRSERVSSWALSQGLVVTVPTLVEGTTVMGLEPTPLGLEVGRVAVDRAVERVLEHSTDAQIDSRDGRRDR